MDPTMPQFLRIDREVRGPCDLAAIRRLIENEVVARDTEAALTASGPWQPLESFAGVEALLPARKMLGFKAAAFAVTNTAASPPIDLKDVIAAADSGGRVLRPSHPPDLAAHLAAKAAAPPNEVELMVQEVNRVQAQFAPPPPPPPKWRPSRKLKYVVATGLLGNLALVAIPVAYGSWGEFWTMLVWQGWVVMFNGGLVAAYFALPKEG
jgi:hypothetical protein